MRTLLSAAAAAFIAFSARAAEPGAAPPGAGTGKAQTQQDTSGQGTGKASVQRDTSGQGTGKAQTQRDTSGQGTGKAPRAGSAKAPPPKVAEPKPCEPVKPCSID